MSPARCNFVTAGSMGSIPRDLNMRRRVQDQGLYLEQRHVSEDGERSLNRHPLKCVVRSSMSLNIVKILQSK